MNDWCRGVIVGVYVGDTFRVVCMLSISICRSLPYDWGLSSTAGRYNLWLVTVATIQTERNTQHKDNADHHRDGDFYVTDPGGGGSGHG